MSGNPTSAFDPKRALVATHCRSRQCHQSTAPIPKTPAAMNKKKSRSAESKDPNNCDTWPTQDSGSVPRRGNHFIPINVFPNNLIRSHTIITRNAVAHRYLSRSFAPEVSFGIDVRAVELLGLFWGSTKPADEGVEGVSFLIARCSVAARGT